MDSSTRISGQMNFWFDTGQTLRCPSAFCAETAIVTDRSIVTIFFLGASLTLSKPFAEGKLHCKRHVPLLFFKSIEEKRGPHQFAWYTESTRTTSNNPNWFLAQFLRTHQMFSIIANIHSSVKKNCDKSEKVNFGKPQNVFGRRSWMITQMVMVVASCLCLLFFFCVLFCFSMRKNQSIPAENNGSSVEIKQTGPMHIWRGILNILR